MSSDDQPQFDPRCFPPESFRRELKEHLGVRVTVIWHCADTVLCSTGKIIEVGTDFVEVHGIVPTFDDTATDGCQDVDGTELSTVIPLENVCAVIERVPDDRKAGLPICCSALDPKPGA